MIKRLALVLAAVLGALLLVEAAGWVLFSRGGQHALAWQTFEDAREKIRQTSRVHTPGSDRAAEAARNTAEATDTYGGQPYEEALHPYTGYVRSHTQSRGGEHVPPRSLGFETDDPVREREPGKRIVAVVGGSVAQGVLGFGLDDFRAALDELGALGDDEPVFVNLAMGGYKQPQQLLAVTYLLSLGAEFDVVVNVDGFNEVALHEPSNGAAGVFPAYPRNWKNRALAAPDPESRRTLGEMVYVKAERADLAVGHSTAPWRYSLCANLVWRWRDRPLEARQTELGEAIVHQRQAGMPYSATGPEWSFADDEELYAHLAGIWRDSSLQLHRLCEAAGATYLHFLQPNQYVPDSKPMGEREREVAFRADHVYRPGAVKGYPHLRREGERLRELGVDFHDLTELFADHPEPLYKDDCCHLNFQGQALLTRAIAAALAEAR